MAQQHWGGQPVYGTNQPPYRQPGQGYRPAPAPYGQPYGGYGQPQFGPPGFGGPQIGVPQYGPAPSAPGPRRRNPLKALLLGMIGVTVLAMIGLVLVNLVSGPAEVAYQNDDYKVPPADTNPPPIPVPNTYAEAHSYVEKNPFYGQSAPLPVRCTLQPIDVSSASDPELKAYFEGFMECLLRVWQPPVTAAGFQIVRPTVTIYGKEITTKCGKGGPGNAFYCSGDQQLYYSNTLDDYFATVKEEKWAADVVIAHEFGHALQGRTGILIAAHALGAQNNDKQEDLLYSRRLELQADCLSGMFMRAVSKSLNIQQSDVAGIEKMYVAVGDDVITGKPDIIGNHGLARSRRAWGNTGLGTSAVGVCNTFVVPESQVR